MKKRSKQPKKSDRLETLAFDNLPEKERDAFTQENTTKVLDWMEDHAIRFDLHILALCARIAPAQTIKRSFLFTKLGDTEKRKAMVRAPFHALNNDTPDLWEYQNNQIPTFLECVERISIPQLRRLNDSRLKQKIQKAIRESTNQKFLTRLIQETERLPKEILHILMERV